MISRSDLAAIFHRLADEIEKVDAPSAPAPPKPPAPAPPPAPPVVAPTPASDPPPLPAPPVASAPKAPLAPEVPKPVIDLDTIKGIQQAYNSIRAPNYPVLEENGIYDAVMAFALKNFQATAGIPTTGEADKITIDTLHKAIFGTVRT